MASVTLTITDAPHGVTAVCESVPDIPLDAQGNPRVESLTPAQGLVIFALMQITEHLDDVEWRTLIK